MEGLWECKVNATTFKPYSPSDCQALERAFNAPFDSARNRVEIMGGEYFVNVNQLLQYKSDDLMKQRLVRRRLVPQGTIPAQTGGGSGSVQTTACAASSSLAGGNGGQKRQRNDDCANNITSSSYTPNHVPQATVINCDDDILVIEKKKPSDSSHHDGRKEVSHTTPLSPHPSTTGGGAPTMFSRPAGEGPKAAIAPTGAGNKKVIVMDRFANTVMHLYCPPPKQGSGAAVEQYKLVGSDIIVSTSTPRDVLQVLRRALAKVPGINKAPLSTCAKVGRPHTRQWLKQIGRVSKAGVFLHLANPITTLPKSLQVNLSPKYNTTVGELITQRDAARFTIIGPPPVRKSNVESASVLVTCINAATPEPLSDEEHLKAQLMMISGPITMLYDNDFGPVLRAPEVICCSIPGINFEYSGVDRRAWLKPTNPSNPNGDMEINMLQTLDRMRLIWAHTLATMECVHQVKYACLCAIGCGAFKGSYGDAIPEMWGRALALAVTKTKLCEATGQLVPAPIIMNGSSSDKGVYEILEAVTVSIPTFGADNNINPFNKGLSTGLAAVKAGANTSLANHPGALSYPPVLLVEDASMTTMATYFKVLEKRQSGILNPSDVQAIRHGWVGMYWDAGHVALEELLATCTTLLLHHVGICRELYEDVNRRIFFEI